MQLVTENISIDDLKKMSEKMFGGLVKAVVDVEKGIMVVDAEMHADQEEFLLEQGSKQKNLWGVNIHPLEVGDAFIEYDSMINMRPSYGNKTRSVDDLSAQKKIMKIVNSLVKR